MNAGRNEMKQGVRTATVVVTLLSLAGLVSAQHEGHQMGGLSTGGGTCLANAKESLRIVESANLRLEEARQTNSPQRMRAAIGDLQAALAEVRTQLSLCVSPAKLPGASAAPSMEGMDHSSMPGMDHSGMEGMDHSGRSTAATGKSVDPVCGMEVDVASAPKATLEGKTYFFCSQADKAKFLKSPATYSKH